MPATLIRDEKIWNSQQLPELVASHTLSETCSKGQVVVCSSTIGVRIEGLRPEDYVARG